MIIRGSYAIKDIINRDVKDYDIYMTYEELDQIISKGSCEQVLSKYLLRGYLSKTIEINIMEGSYFVELEKALEGYKLDEILLEGKLLVSILPLELSIVEKLAHEHRSMKPKWRRDLDDLKSYYPNADLLKRKYKNLYESARIKNRVEIKDYILSKYYKKQKDVKIDITLPELLSLIKQTKTLPEVISILSGAYNKGLHSLYIKNNFEKLFKK